MPYIGHNPTNAGSFIFLDDIASSFNGSATQFNLAVGGVAITPNTQNLLIALDGVIQQAPDAYTVSGSSITFTAAIPANTDFYGILMGQSASIGQGTIGADELKVTGNGTNGQVLVSDGDGTFSWSTDAEPYLPLAGGTMTGTLAMGSNNITGTGTIGGTLTTAAQANITSVGTLSSLDVSGAITAGTSFTLDNASGSAVIRSQSSFNNTVDLTASSGGDAFIEASDTSQIKIGHASGTKLTIDTHANSGRVGIGQGATSPVGNLDVAVNTAGSRRFEVSYENSIVSLLATSGSTGSTRIENLGIYGDSISFYTDDTTSTAMTIDSSQRVGIGETSPDGMLHIKKDAGTHHLIIEESSNTASRSWALSGAKGDLGYGKLGLYPGTSQGGTPGNTPTMTFLPTGEVGIGVASPESLLHIQGASATAVGARLTLDNNVGSSLNNAVEIAMLTDSGASVAGVSNARIKAINTNASNGAAAITFTTWSGSSEGERTRITSGGRLIAGGGAPEGSHSERLGVKCLDRYGIFVSDNMSSGTTTIMRMYDTNATNVVGSITSTSSGTAYNSSSDYRLKENEVLISDGLTRLNQLKPYRFNFIADADTTVDGFFAHEVAEVVPEAVSGEKDAVDNNGNIVSQGIDHSKLVPLLVKALQEADDKIDALTARIEALEA